MRKTKNIQLILLCSLSMTSACSDQPTEPRKVNVTQYFNMQECIVIQKDKDRCIEMNGQIYGSPDFDDDDERSHFIMSHGYRSSQLNNSNIKSNHTPIKTGGFGKSGTSHGSSAT